MSLKIIMQIKYSSALRKRLFVLTASATILITPACSSAFSDNNGFGSLMMASVLYAASSHTTGGPFRLNGRTATSVFSDSKVAELANAACTGTATEVKPLVEAGADVNGKGMQGITPLIWAMSCHNYAGINALLEQGANPNLPMDSGDTAVYLAGGGNDPKILPLLLDHGGNPKEIEVFNRLDNRHEYKSPLINTS